MSPNAETLRYVAAEFLTDKVRATADNRRTGAWLREQLNRHYPAVLEGRKLTNFLDQYARGLTIVGRSGADLIWGVDSPDEAPEIELDLTTVEVQLEVCGDPLPIGLSRARFTNYRSLADVTIDLAPITVLVGANGSGKSNILDALFRGIQLTHRKPDVVFDGKHDYARITTRGQPEAFGLEMYGPDGWYHRFDASPADGSGPQFCAAAGGAERVLKSLLLTPLSQAFGPAVYLRLSASALARPSHSLDEAPYLKHNGFYLATVLSYLAEADRRRFDSIVESVREIIPQVQDIRTLRRKMTTTETTVIQINGQPQALKQQREVIGHQIEVKVRGSGWTPADQLSEGTLLVIGLHTILSRHPGPKLILLDDIDRGLHPNAQRALIDQLARMTGPQRRLVCTSHSPFILDRLPPDAVRFVMLDDDGRTRVSRLDEHPEWAEWQDEMNAAEFWLYAGDRWSPDPSTP